MRVTPFKMQHRYSNERQPAISSPSPAQQVPQNRQPSLTPNLTNDELARVFNTALISTQTELKREFSAELSELTQSASFKAILSAVRHLSRVQGITERQAA